ncbi:MAG: hypothetical protein Q9183_006968 [Haloplaca sp. 2 TL-2023]
MISVSSIYGEIKASRHYLIGLQKLQWETLDSTLRQFTASSSIPELKHAITNYQEVQRDVEAKLDAEIVDMDRVICYIDDREASLREWHRNRRTRPFPENILQMHYVKLPKARPVPDPSESHLVPHCSALPKWLNEKVSLLYNNHDSVQELFAGGGSQTFHDLDRALQLHYATLLAVVDPVRDRTSPDWEIREMIMRVGGDLDGMEMPYGDGDAVFKWLERVLNELKPILKKAKDRVWEVEGSGL